MKSEGQIQPYHQSDEAAQQYPTREVVVHDSSGNKWTMKETLMFGGIAIGLTALSVWLLTKAVRNVVSHKEHDKSWEDENSATWAKQIKMALDSTWGTDEAAIRKTLREMKTQKDFDDTIKSFRRLYEGKNLLETFQEELTQMEYDEFMAIIAGKPKKPGDPVVYNHKAWARRLWNAMEQEYFGFFPGTDEDAIYKVFDEIPNYTEYKKVAAAYKNEYGSELYDDLMGDLEWYEVTLLINKVAKKGA